MLERFEVPFPLEEGTEMRNAYVYLPDSYYKNKRRRYPVLYMFDGHNVFFDEDATYGKSWGMYNYMERTHTQMIIAAVECNHNPDNGRLKEYSPFTFKDPHFGMVPGLGKTTMEWYVNEFKPYIDANFRTKPGRNNTFIAGSSMGGLMSLYALIEYNHVFSRAAALSPSLWTSPMHLKNMIKYATVDPNTVLYMDYGAKEFGNHKNQRRAFGEIAMLLMWHNIMLDCRIIPGGTHSEGSWERQIPFFMHTLLYKE